MNINQSFTKQQAIKICEHLKPIEGLLHFQPSDLPTKLLVSHITVGPFPEEHLKSFIDAYFPMFKGKDFLETYTGTTFKVIAVAHPVTNDTASVANPFFFDILELQEKGIKGFCFPESILEN